MIPRSLALLVLTLAAAQPAMAQGAMQPGPLKAFKDWVVGCDNLRSCSALGLAPEDSSGAYVRIDRGGAAADEPSVVFSVMADDAPKAATLALAIDGKPVPGLAPLTAKIDGSFVTAALSPAEGRRLIAALRPAKAMTLEMHDGAKPAVTFNISLAGSAAALLFMDDLQGRVGGVTALARSGTAPASAVPALPALPVIKALKMTDLAKAPPLPKGIKRDTDGGCEATDITATELSNGKQLWTVCSNAAAYNTVYRTWIVSGGTVTKASFPTPDSDDPAEITNPGLSEDGYTLTSFAKGRGIGDCGEISEWAWDGTRFRLVDLTLMDTCRGVMPDDWPTLFRAKIEKAG